MKLARVRVRVRVFIYIKKTKKKNAPEGALPLIGRAIPYLLKVLFLDYFPLFFSTFFAVSSVIVNRYEFSYKILRIFITTRATSPSIW
jgi:hypothetical protein